MLSKDDVNSLPDKPGVYFFKTRKSEILYIGKAKSLRKRVRSYTYRSYKHSKRTRRLVRRIRSVDYTVCGSELEALLLESRLIKEHLPEFNIMQRKLRHFPFVKITMNEEFPRVFLAWDIESDGAKYLGPFARVAEAGETVGLIHRLFPVRQCEKETFSKRHKACLNYHIQKCLASIGAYNKTPTGEQSDTYLAVTEFQQMNKLKVDGLIGKKTWALISNKFEKLKLE